MRKYNVPNVVCCVYPEQNSIPVTLEMIDTGDSRYSPKSIPLQTDKMVSYAGQRLEVSSDSGWEQNPQAGSVLQDEEGAAAQLEIVSTPETNALSYGVSTFGGC